MVDEQHMTQKQKTEIIAAMESQIESLSEKVKSASSDFDKEGLQYVIEVTSKAFLAMQKIETEEETSKQLRISSMPLSSWLQIAQFAWPIFKEIVDAFLASPAQPPQPPQPPQAK